MSSEQKLLRFKCVVVGDRIVGKTSMILKSLGKHPTDRLAVICPTVTDDSERNIMVKEDGRNIPVVLKVHDTAAHEEYNTLRRELIYPGTNIFLVCFSICSRPSFENISEKWIPKLKTYCPDVLFLLIGCKNDLRDEFYDSVTLVDGYLRESEKINIIPKGIIKIIEEYAHKRRIDLISDEEASELCKKIGAVTYISCSAAKDLQEGNIEEIFHEAAKYCVRSMKAPDTSCCKTSGCNIQ